MLIVSLTEMTDLLIKNLNYGTLGAYNFCEFVLICDLRVSLSISFTGKFGAVLASIPLPIVAALYCVLYAYVG